MLYIQLCVFVHVVELNGLESRETYIGNAYLEVFTKEKVCTIGSPEFGLLEVHNLIIVKDLCVLRTSGLSCHESLADCLRDMRFEPCKMEPDI